VSVVRNRVRSGLYRDSVALMRSAQLLAALPGVEEAGLMIGTEANKEVLREAGILAAEGAAAGPGDVIIALRARDATAADAAMAEAGRLFERQADTRARAPVWRPRTLRSALRQMPDANLVMISLGGAFAAAPARQALHAGRHVMIFSDNVPLSDEVALKTEARRLGLLVMGPDCGTAIIAGCPLGFANAVPRGDVGIIGASGTGIQELACLIGNAGGGVAHALGTGGRDLSAEVGGISTLAALDLLEGDPATSQLVVVSKPAAPPTAARLYARAAACTKPVTLCILGEARPADGALADGAPAGGTRVRRCATLHETAETVLGRTLALYQGPVRAPHARGRAIRGLFCGGTLCAEAQLVLRRAGEPVASNLPGAAPAPPGAAISTLLDLGDDAFTRGRPHPLIDPAQRTAPLARACADATVGVILLDVILGWGSHPDPAGEIVRALGQRGPDRPVCVASVTGTEADPQVRSLQIARLLAAGVLIAPSNAEAAALALRCARS
jgi:FdrA protein